MNSLSLQKTDGFRIKQIPKGKKIQTSIKIFPKIDQRSFSQGSKYVMNPKSEIMRKKIENITNNSTMPSKRNLRKTGSISTRTYRRYHTNKNNLKKDNNVNLDNLLSNDNDFFYNNKEEKKNFFNFTMSDISKNDTAFNTLEDARLPTEYGKFNYIKSFKAFPKIKTGISQLETKANTSRLKSVGDNFVRKLSPKNENEKEKELKNRTREIITSE